MPLRWQTDALGLNNIVHIMPLVVCCKPTARKMMPKDKITDRDTIGCYTLL